MTVNTQNITSGPYVGNDIASTFSYTFRVEDKTQLSVFETDLAGVRTELTVDTDYTVGSIGNDAGGLITRVAGALPLNFEWFIRSNYKSTQLTAFPSQGPFFPETHEAAMDKLTFLIQQLQDSRDRSFRLDDSIDIDGVFTVVQDATVRADTFIGFDSSGNIVTKTASDAGLVDQADQDLRYSLTFATVAAMTAAAPLALDGSVVTLVAGMIVYTGGRYVLGDNGAGRYLAVASQAADEWGDHTAANGIVLILQYDLYPTLSQYGCRLDFAADDTLPLAAAIAKLEGSGVPLWCNAGGCRTTATIDITQGMRFIGPGWEPYATRVTGDLSENARGAGFYFYTSSDFLGIQFNITSLSGVFFEDLAFDQLQPAPAPAWTPNLYDWRIFTGSCENLHLKNVFVRKSTKFVRVDNSNGGAERLTIDGLYGHNLGTMVDIDFQSDVNRINNLHCWPFWSLDITNIRAYTHANSVAILSGRNDNAMWNNIFAFGHKEMVLFKLSETAGAGSFITNKFRLSNSDCDVSNTAMRIPAGVNGVTGQISNLTGQGQSSLTGSKGIEFLGNSARIHFDNLRLTNYYLQALRIAGTSNKVFIDNSEYEGWGLDTSSGAVAVDSGNTLKLGSNFDFVPTSSTARWSIQAGANVFVDGSDTVKIVKDATVQTLTDGVSTLCTWQTAEEDNTNTNTVLGSDHIIPLVPGLYSVRASVGFNSSVDGVLHDVSITKSGVKKVSKTVRSSGVNNFVVTVEGVIRLNGSSDYASVLVQQNSGGAVSLSTDVTKTFFELHRIG